MTKMIKFSMPLALVAAGFLVACGDDSSSAEEPVSEVVDLKAPFEMITDKAKYSYNSKDSTLIIKEPVCKEGSLGNLVWKASEEEPDTLKAYINKSTITLIEDDADPTKFQYDGSKFPVGLWMDSEYNNKSFLNGLRLTSDNMIQEVFRFDGNCFLKDFYTAGFRKGNEALEEADSVLTAFYMRFRAPSDTLDEAEMLRNIRVPDCDAMYLYDDLVKVSIGEFTPHSGDLSVAYGDKVCKIEFSFRYAYNEQDCMAAYADWQDDKGTNSEFRFHDYWRDVTYDDYCIEELILAMKKAEGIPLKKDASEADVAKSLANMVVDLVVGGMK